MRLVHVVLTLVFLMGGIAVVLYTGPGRVWVRGSVGDVLIVPFLVHGLGILVPRHAQWRIAAVGLFALGAELLQLAKLVAPDAPDWLHLTLGSTFDPWDLLGYSIGIGVAILTAVGLHRWGPSAGNAHDPPTAVEAVD